MSRTGIEEALFEVADTVIRVEPFEEDQESPLTEDDKLYELVELVGMKIAHMAKNQSDFTKLMIRFVKLFREEANL